MSMPMFDGVVYVAPPRKVSERVAELLGMHGSNRAQYVHVLDREEAIRDVQALERELHIAYAMAEQWRAKQYDSTHKNAPGSAGTPTESTGNKTRGL